VQLLTTLIQSRRFELAITFLIIVNAITLGLETSGSVMAQYGGLLKIVDRIVLSAFVVELALRILVYRGSFFRDPWRVFDFIVVAIALMPATGSLSVLRALRILRVLRLVSVVPSLRRVVSGLISALPGMGSIVLLLGLVFYVFSVMATKLFGDAFPEKFGSLGGSAYTLFEIMTMDSWSTGTVRPMLDVHPWAWTFFLPFIVVTSFAVLNLFIGIIVSAMQGEHDETMVQERSDEQAAVLAEIRALRAEVQALHSEREGA
jgi:voltage-gated sodium channel